MGEGIFVPITNVVLLYFIKCNLFFKLMHMKYTYEYIINVVT